MNQTKAKEEMTEGQKAIVEGLKVGHFGIIDTSDSHTTTLKAIQSAVPKKNLEEIGKELENWEGVKRVGQSIDDQISIPGKYFK